MNLAPQMDWIGTGFYAFLQTGTGVAAARPWQDPAYQDPAYQDCPSDYAAIWADIGQPWQAVADPATFAHARIAGAPSVP
jgi:hypothetical protein